MELHSLNAISPIDGRYHKDTQQLSKYGSEGALIGARMTFEVHYLQALASYAEQHGIIMIRPFTEKQLEMLDGIKNEFCFNEDTAVWVKAVEKKTNHDVKAVEYVLREMLQKRGFGQDAIAHLHFGLTSEDVNNVAMAELLHRMNHELLVEVLEDVMNAIWNLAHEYARTPMLARTHGQPATPTSFGKEMMVFVQCLKRDIDKLRTFKFRVKLTGASGNLNGHRITYPEVNWPQFVYEFFDQHYRTADGPMFEVNEWTTQIEDHGTYAEFFAIYHRINTFLLKFCKDMWLYISRDLVKQKPKDGEVGSSTMPHKVNPINFENAEGNLGLANALFDFFSRKLSDSRLQRDLSDSTIERNFGTVFAHCLIAYKNILKGLDKIAVNTEAMVKEVDEHPQVLAEAYQLVLKRYGHADAYENLKELTRGQPEITLEVLHTFIDQFDIPIKEKARLKALQPSTYLGYAPGLAAGHSLVDQNYRLKE